MAKKVDLSEESVNMFKVLAGRTKIFIDTTRAALGVPQDWLFNGQSFIEPEGPEDADTSESGDTSSPS